MKVYMEMKNMQLELIRFRYKYRIYSGFLCRTDEVNATRSRVYECIVVTAQAFSIVGETGASCNKIN